MNTNQVVIQSDQNLGTSLPNDDGNISIKSEDNQIKEIQIFDKPVSIG